MANTVQLSFPTRVVFSSQQPSQSRSSGSEEELVGKTLTDWLGQTQRVPQDARGEYQNAVRTHLTQLRTQITFIRADLSSEERKLKIQELISEHGEALSRFYSRNVTYMNAQLSESSQNTTFTQRLMERVDSFGHYRIPSTPPGQAVDPIQFQAQEDFLGATMGVHFASKTLETAADALVSTAKAACNSTDITRQACKSTLQFAKDSGKTLLEVTGTKEIVKEAIAYLQSCDGSSLAEVLEKRYGFPRSQAEILARYGAEDVKELTGAAAAWGVTSVTIKAGKLALNGIRNMAAGSAAAEEATATSATTTALLTARPELANRGITLALPPPNPGITLALPAPNPGITLALPPPMRALPKPEGMTPNTGGSAVPSTTPSVSAPAPPFAPPPSGPIADTISQINEYGSNYIHFPSTQALQETPIYVSHRIWSRNQRTIIGMIAEMEVANVGYSGATAEGVSQIFGTQEGSIMVSGLLGKSVNPMTAYADMIAAGNQTAQVSRKGGARLVVDTTEAIPSNQSFTAAFQQLEKLDTAEHIRMLALMKRTGRDSLITRGPTGKTVISEDAFANVGEFQVNLNPDNFDGFIRGVIPYNETLYPIHGLRAGAVEPWKVLVERFKAQELAIRTFRELKLIRDAAVEPWEEYYNSGKAIVRLPRESVAVPFEAEGALTPGRRFLSPYDTSPLSSMPPTPIKTHTMTRKQIKNLQEIDLHAMYCVNREDMFLRIVGLTGREGVPVNPTHVMDELIQFAEHGGAKRLFVEMTPHPDVQISELYRRHHSGVPKQPLAYEIDGGFSEWIQHNYPVILERDYISQPVNRTSTLFQIPLSDRPSVTPSPPPTITAAKRSPLRMSFGGLVHLGQVNQVRNTLDKIYSALQPAGRSLYDDLTFLGPQLKRIIPTLSFAERNILNSSERSALEIPFVRDSHSIKIIDRGEEFILKKFRHPKEGKALVEAASEALGLDIVRPLNLDNGNLPKIVAFGIYEDSSTPGYAFILKTRTPGNVLDNSIELVGEIPFSPEREAAFLRLQPAAVYTGKFLAELQTKGAIAQFPSFTPETFARMAAEYSACYDLEKQYLYYYLAEAQSGLAAIKSDLRIYNIENIDVVLTQFKESPGGLTVGLGDIHAGQFSYDPTNLFQPIGFFDTEAIPHTVNGWLEPMQSAAREFQEGRRMFLNAGYAGGLTLKESRILQNLYTDAYFGEYGGPSHYAVAANRHYHLRGSLRSLGLLTAAIKEVGTVSPTTKPFLNYLVNDINQILAAPTISK